MRSEAASADARHRRGGGGAALVTASTTAPPMPRGSPPATHLAHVLLQLLSADHIVCRPLPVGSLQAGRLRDEVMHGKALALHPAAWTTSVRARKQGGGASQLGSGREGARAARFHSQRSAGPQHTLGDGALGVQVVREGHVVHVRAHLVPAAHQALPAEARWGRGDGERRSSTRGLRRVLRPAPRTRRPSLCLHVGQALRLERPGAPCTRASCSVTACGSC